MDIEAFPNYKQLTARLPTTVWWVLRWTTFLITLFVIFMLLAEPSTGLVIFWQLLIPLLPLSFALMPGVWRNICPMALLNQLPRQLGLSREQTLPAAVRKLALYVSILAFILFVLFRHPLLNHSGMILAIILLLALSLALLGGYLFKGRSGWCGTFCPLAPLQKSYGHAPLVLVRNGYCKSCLGCQKNCYDFNPRAAIFSDLNDADGWWSEQRKFFIAVLPGLIIAFFNANYQPDMSTADYLLVMLVPMVVSIGIFYTLHNLIQVNFFRLTSLFSMSALAIFYWYGTPVAASGLDILFSVTLSDSVILSIRFCVIALCVSVLIRGLISERDYRQSLINSTQASLGTGVGALKSALSHTSQIIQIKEQSSGRQILVRSGQSMLDALEEAELPIMSGCRMGMCGSDPVVITDGIESLEPPEENELNTLRRLGLEGRARLACCCKPRAAMTIDLGADPAQISFESDETESDSIEQDDERLQIIIVGNGIAGISTAETIREQNADCRIILITKEPYHFYNRMGLEKVIYGRTAMQGLYLMKNEWYERNKIDFWLNTQVTSIDSGHRKIVLGTGESVSYDKLVLATGAHAFVPDQQDFQLSGVFTLRSADDALSLRSWVQQHDGKRAVVLGGGVLGVEAAEALLQLGLKVSLVHAGEYLMNRQLDKNAAEILTTFLENKGVRVFINNGIKKIEQSAELKRVWLNDQSILDTDIVLLCIGIRSDTELACSAGLEINRGVVVDDQMRTSEPDIFCVGDAAELPGSIGGLWSVGSEQGKVAADVILGGCLRYRAQSLPPVQLKVSGIDLKSFGALKTGSADTRSFSSGSVSANRWCHMQVREGMLTGGVFVNSPLSASAAINATKKENHVLSSQDIDEMLNRDKR